MDMQRLLRMRKAVGLLERKLGFDRTKTFLDRATAPDLNTTGLDNKIIPIFGFG
ncbi:hypothetical protein GX48_06369, partial [Paracoccidioides brasiliensis]